MSSEDRCRQVEQRVVINGLPKGVAGRSIQFFLMVEHPTSEFSYKNINPLQSRLHCCSQSNPVS